MNLPPHNPGLVVATDGFWDPDAPNGLRAQSARDAMLHYQKQRRFETEEVTCVIDLITDLLHHLHALGEDPSAAMEKARQYFESEAGGKSLLIVA